MVPPPINLNEMEVDEEELQMQEAMKLSLQSFNEQQKRNSRATHRASSSAAQAQAGPGPSTLRSRVVTSNADSLKRKISDCQAKLDAVRREIRTLQQEENEYVQEMSKLMALQRETMANSAIAVSAHATNSNGATIDYFATDFPWSASMKAKMDQVFGIQSFRLCQEGVCNANMDGRDIVCVMPTGGGKSLTYQLPAIMSGGCTLVISPLIALMTDQVIHLRENDVMAVMLTSVTSKEEALHINNQLGNMAQARTRSKEDIKLCYVTPEKIAQSKSFLMKMQKLADANKLDRIVIDEAHCISEQGHDFRQDYLRLSMCKKLWPKVPILALSATCPPAVLRDIVKVLDMKPIVNGHAAPPQGTLYFTSPLYRKNLHYRVLPKPSSGARLIEEITGYILKHHANNTGIIYCATKRDANTVAEAIRRESNNSIKTGVYHADVKPDAKFRLHEQWRRGDVKVVCATIAFGLGIDKSDVRFVIHHTLSKSLDGFYQESGRAGRDGQDADCLLYYRPQDGQNLSSRVIKDSTGKARLYEMIRFAQNLDECRKVHFAKYFNVSLRLDTASWTTAEEDALSPCGHCDNCTREKGAVKTEDVTVAAWRILTIAEAVRKERGRITLSKLADMARGAGNGEFNVAGKGRRGKGTTSSLDKEAVGGDVVKLSKESTEWLCVHLVLEGYLKEVWVQTPYDVKTYIEPGVSCHRITGRSFAQVKDGGGERIHCNFLQKIKKTTAKQPNAGNAIDSDEEPDSPPVQSGSAKRKRRVPSTVAAPTVDSNEDSEALREIIRLGGGFSDSSDEDIDDDDDDGWSHQLRAPTLRKKPRRTTKAAVEEVIELSSD